MKTISLKNGGGSIKLLASFLIFASIFFYGCSSSSDASKLAKNYYITPLNSSSKIVDGVNLTNGSFNLSESDLKGKRLLSVNRVYNSLNKDKNQSFGNFELSILDKLNPKIIYNNRAFKSKLYLSAKEACEDGFRDLENSIYLGKLKGFKPIYNESKGLCDIYNNSKIVASLVVANKKKNSLVSKDLILLKSSNSSEYLFFKDKNNNYISLTKDPITLKKDSNGNFIVGFLDDTKKIFDKNFKLIQIKKDASILNIEYNNSKIVKLSNGLNQSIELKYNKDGLIKEIKSFDDTITKYSYDDKNSLTKITYPDNSTKSFEYDSNNNLTAVINASGVKIKNIEYDSNNKVASISNANGANKMSFSYNSDTAVTSNNTPRVYSFITQYSKLKLKTISDDEGVEEYEYDLNGYQKSYTNKLGIKTLTTYNDRGLLVSKTTNANTKDKQTTLISYSDRFNKAIKVVKPNVATFYEYNDKGLVTKRVTGKVSGANFRLTSKANFKLLDKPLFKEIATDIKETSITYNDKGLPTSTTAPNKAVSQSQYDEYGNPIEQINPLGFKTESEYDKAGRPIKTIDENGIVTTTKYDSMGRVLEQTTDNKTTKYEYDSNGRLTKTIYPDGLITYSKYDANSNVIESGDNQGNKTLNEYDKNNNLIKTQTFKNNTLTYQSQSEYDSKNRLIAQIDGLGNKTTFIYNQKGQKIKTIDPLGRVTKYEYDELGRLIKEIRPDQSTISYSYNKDGLKTKVVTPNQATFAFSYDSYNRVIKKDNPDRGTTTYSYDVSDNIIKECDSKDNCIEYSYDLLNRKTKEIFSDGTTIEYEYDNGENAKGKLTKVTDSSGSTEFAYDKDGNIISKTQSINNQSFTTTYSYNDEGKLTSQTLPSGKTIEYSYNQKGELESISIDGETLIENIQSSNQGLLSYSYPDGNKHQRVYDTAGRLTKLIYPNYTKELSYNPANNIVKQTTNNQEKQFNYDLADRLISYDNNASDYQRFSYDDNGNRLSQAQEQNISATLNYKELSNILTKVAIYKKIDTNTTQKLNEYNLTYDKNGNLIDDSIHTYSYDSKNRLIAIDNNISYSYNYKNQRVSKTINNQTTYFIYDDYKLIGEYNQDGTPIKEYIYLNNTPIAILTQNNTYYIYADHINTPRAVTDTDNNIIWKWESKPFGETKPNQDPDQNGNSFTLNLRFPGQYADSESGLYYNFNRYYSPKIGRYITSDPIGLEGGVNTYLYAGADPVGKVDPEGKLGLDTLIKGGVWVVKKIGSGIKNVFNWFKSLFVDSLNLTAAQKARLNTIKEIIHNLEVRKSLSGDVLDIGHIIKLKNNKKGLEKAINALKNSLKNPKLGSKERKVIEEAIENAEKVIERINELLN